METRFSDPKAEHLWAHAQIGLAFVGHDGSWLRANPYLCELLGYTEVELLSRTFQQITHPDDVDADENMVRAVLDGKIPYYTMTKRYLPKIGQPIWIRLHVSRITDPASKSMAFFLSQVSPVDPSVMKPVPIEEPPATVDDVALWVRKNWKALIGAGAILGAAVGKLMRLW